MLKKLNKLSVWQVLVLLGVVALIILVGLFALCQPNITSLGYTHGMIVQQQESHPEGHSEQTQLSVWVKIHGYPTPIQWAGSNGDGLENLIDLKLGAGVTVLRVGKYLYDLRLDPLLMNDAGGS